LLICLLFLLAARLPRGTQNATGPQLSAVGQTIAKISVAAQRESAGEASKASQFPRLLLPLSSRECLRAWGGITWGGITWGGVARHET
jgi:hypothetical protein